VVAAPQFPLTNDHTPGGPDAGDVVNQPGDMSFIVTSVLNASAHPNTTLSDLVDPNEVGAAGHSNGAITTLGLIANTCCKDQRVKAAVVMAGDEVPFSGGTYEMAAAPPPRRSCSCTARRTRSDPSRSFARPIDLMPPI